MYNDLSSFKDLKDEELIDLVQNRNEAAFSELLSRYTPRIWRVIVVNSRQRRDAEEILTDVWVAVWENISTLKKKSSFGPWLQKIAYNACKRYYTSANRLQNEIPYPNAELFAHVDRDAAPRYREYELRNEAREAVQHLPERVRPVGELYYLEGWTMKEIAEELDLPIGTVKTKLRETRALLQKEFDVEPKKGGIMSSEFVQDQNLNEEQNDERLIIAAVIGDCQAIELLKEMMKPWIRNSIEGFFGRYDEEMKALEFQTLENVINSFNTFRSVDFFHSYVQKITRCRCIQHYHEHLFYTKEKKQMAEQKRSSGCGCGPPRELVEAFEKTQIIPKELSAMKVESPPTIDGKLDDIVWQDAPKAVDFTDRNTGGEPAKNQTEVKMVYTDKAIYIAGYFYDDKPDQIVATVTEDQIRPRTDDRISFTIDPFHTHQFNDRTFFMVNPLGSKFVSHPPKNVPRIDVPKLWNAAANIVEDGWVVEMEIPWNMLNYPQTTVPIQIGINFDRWQPRIRENAWWSKAGFGENGRPDGHWQDVVPPPK